MRKFLSKLCTRFAVAHEHAAQPLPASFATDADNRAMNRAIELAQQAAAIDEVPVGAVVYETATGTTIAEAHNRREIDADPAAHAELLAIRAAAKTIDDWRLTKYTCVVTLEPCTMCAGALVNARVGRVVFGAFDPKAGATGSLYNICADTRLNHRPEVVGGVRNDDCANLLRSFFRQKRNQRKANKTTNC